MFANVTSHGLKVQKITPVRPTKQSLRDSKSESAGDSDIYYECSDYDLECSLSASFLSKSNVLV